MFGRLFTLLVILLILALAIMFDWFGARSLFEEGLDKTEQTVESLSDTGDRLQHSFESNR